MCVQRFLELQLPVPINNPSMFAVDVKQQWTNERDCSVSCFRGLSPQLSYSNNCDNRLVTGKHGHWESLLFVLRQDKTRQGKTRQDKTMLYYPVKGNLLWNNLDIFLLSVSFVFDARHGPMVHCVFANFMWEGLIRVESQVTFKQYILYNSVSATDNAR